MAVLSGDISGTNANIKTYGAILLPLTPEEFEPISSDTAKTSLKGKIKSGFQKASSAIKESITNPKETFDKLGKYLSDERNMQKLKNGALAKFSGIAVTQALMNGKVETKEALDYLFMGFAPALNVTAASLGYSGLEQMKSALSNGTVNVGGFVNGFSTAIKGVVDLKDKIRGDETKTRSNAIEIDLTISHSESYQSETPDRRTESGNTLAETVHNLPVTMSIDCAIEDGKRYSVSDLRNLFADLRLKKTPVTVVMGDDFFYDMILTNFEPNKDTTRSGFDYTLQFKEITVGFVGFQEVDLQTLPVSAQDTTTVTQTVSTGGLATNASKTIKEVGVSQTNMPIDPTKLNEQAKSMAAKSLIQSSSKIKASELWKIQHEKLLKIMGN